MRLFSSRRVGLLVFALFVLFAMVAAQSDSQLEVSEEMNSDEMNDAELDALLDDAEALGLDTGGNEGAPSTGAVEPVPEVPEPEREPEPEPEPELEPEPEPVEALPEPIPEKKKEQPKAEKPKLRPKPVAASPPSQPRNKGPPPTLVAKPSQEPGPCSYCKASAHRLQTALHGAHRDHHDDEYSIEEARLGQKELPEQLYVKHMREICKDKEYWQGYKSFKFEHNGATVLTGSGLDWSAINDPRAKPTGVDHSSELMASCSKMETEAEKTGLYHAWWTGASGYTGRKWFFQDAFCGAKGHACHPDSLRKKHDEL